MKRYGIRNIITGRLVNDPATQKPYEYTKKSQAMYRRNRLIYEAGGNPRHYAVSLIRDYETVSPNGCPRAQFD